jgi:DnaJ-class molecular chaperone
MTEQDYYAVLGIAPDSEGPQIKEAFRQKAFEYHPDRNQGDEAAATKMKAVNEAYAVLSNPQKRREYDMLRNNFGSSAYNRFRQTYSDQDIFRNSDLHRVFEELSKSFGLRGFDDVFKDFYGSQYKHFEFRQPGLFAKGFVWFGGWPNRQRIQTPKTGLLMNLARHIIQKSLGGKIAPEEGKDMYDVIELTPDFAVQGGPYAYYVRQLNKKLVVQIPSQVKNGQRIRLAGMGQPGFGGMQNGDLYLKINVRKPLIEKIKTMIGSRKK